MGLSWGPGSAPAWELPADNETPCIFFEPLFGETGDVLDFRWTSMNVPAEGWVRSLELPRHLSLWALEGVALFDVGACVRVLLRGVPHVGQVPGDVAGRQFVVVRHGEGLALWLLPRDESRASDAQQAIRERNARREVEEALARTEQTVSALREAEERYRLATRATHDVLWDWHFATDRVRWDPGTGDAFGHATAVLDHQLGWWGARVHDDDRERVVDRLVTFVASTGDVWKDEYRFQRADGSWAHVLDRGVLARDDEGRPVRMIGSMMDVTERTRELASMVEEARFRERFIGILGHDLRNPLNAIMLSARAQKRRGPLECTPEQHRQHAQRIESSAARMGNMIADLLDLTRARLAGGIPLRKGPTDLAVVCQQVVDELSAAYPERAIAVDVDGKAEGEWDAERLAQVLSNLVGNALEHGTPEAPVFLRCWAKGDHQVVEVQNPGTPIPEELRERLFDPFRQGEGERTQGRRNAGLGLGLFIVKEIVQAHGGTVEVASSQKEGTTFTVKLPRPPRPKAKVRASRSRTRTA